MFEFVNWGLVVLTGLLLLVGIGFLAGEKKDEKSYGFFGGTVFLFVVTLFILPYSEYQTANENINKFNQGEMLQCYTSSGTIGTSEQYMVANDQWEQQHYNFIKKDNRLVVKANHCK